MPLPIINDVYQVRLVWVSSAAPRPAVNTLHFLDNSGSGSSASIWTDLDASVTAGMWELVSSTATVQSVVITPLDGVSASTTITAPAAARWAGSGGSDPILQGCAVVSLKSVQRGPKWRNRIYLPFIGETGQASGTLTPANVANMQTAWSTFLTAVGAAGSSLEVVSPSDEVAIAATSVVVRPYLKTQRRRSRR